MQNIYTAQYRYSGKDRLDITVKGQDSLGKIFAPTWEMVRGVKNGTMTSEEYSRRYGVIIVQALAIPGNIELLHNKYPQDVTFVCFCPKGAFCHRYILAQTLPLYGLGEYRGER